MHLAAFSAGDFQEHQVLIMESCLCDWLNTGKLSEMCGDPSWK